MIFKILAILTVLFLVYILFFKKNRENIINKSKNKEAPEDIMEECTKCNIFISRDEAIVSNGKYYCSEDCLK